MSKRPALIRSLPFALFIGIMIIDPYLQGILPSGVDGGWLYGLRAAAALVCLACFWGHYTELRNGPPVSPGAWTMALGIGAAVFVLWVNLDFPPLALAAGEGFDPRRNGSLNPGLVAMRLAGAGLVVPVMEELFWRSFILRWLQRPAFLLVDPRTVGFRALMVSSFVFAAEHRLWFAGLLAGLAYAWVYRKTGNLWVPIVAHAVTNGLLGVYVLATGSWTLW